MVVINKGVHVRKKKKSAEIALQNLCVDMIVPYESKEKNFRHDGEVKRRKHP